MAWTSDQYKVEPLRVLLVANDLSYLAGILNNYSELLVAARVNALLDCLIQCRTSTHLSVR